MRIIVKPAQRGQATTEFIAAMALFVPLFMAVVYCGKYADIKHQAIQASRYAAMQRVIFPSGSQNDTAIANSTVARFFTDGKTHEIALNDAPQGATAGDENPNWAQLNGDPMIEKYQDISVAFHPKSIDSKWLIPIDLATKAFNGLDNGAATEADIKVQVANIANFPGLDTISLNIRATTVIAAGAWNAGGAADVANHLTALSVPGKAVHILNEVPGIDQVFQLLLGAPAPQFGCVKADVVPDATAPGAAYLDTDPCN